MLKEYGEFLSNPGKRWNKKLGLALSSVFLSDLNQ